MTSYNWKQFHSYRVAPEFFKSLILGKKSYITKHEDLLDLRNGLDEIQKLFIQGADESSDSNFDQKLEQQFRSASDNAKILFTNFEYLRCMHIGDLKTSTKRLFCERWFSPSEINTSAEYFFEYPHCIADFGQLRGRNKYSELSAIIELFSEIIDGEKNLDLTSIFSAIESHCYKRLHPSYIPKIKDRYNRRCSIHPSLLHLLFPEKYQSIIAYSDRQRILGVYGHVLESNELSLCPEKRIRLIRDRLFDLYPTTDEDSHWKYRWFFYMPNVKKNWANKKAVKQQNSQSITLEVSAEEESEELEGAKIESNSYRILRSSKISSKSKKHENYTCQACGFNFQKQIVHSHHLDPLKERTEPKETKVRDLVTLCPTCHYLAHYLLRQSDEFKKRQSLISEIQRILPETKP